MIVGRLRAAAAMLIFTLAAVVGAGSGVSQAAASSPSPGRIGIRLLQVPTSEASDVRARLYIIDHLTQGDVIHREFQVVNLGDSVVHLVIYPAAASIAQGGFQFAPGHTQNDMTSWVSISQAAVSLAPHASATLTATVAVPADAPSGEQYGVIWAEEDTRGAGNINLVSRVGIRLYLSIGTGQTPASNFTIGTPTVGRTAAGDPYIHLPLGNNGGRALDIHGTVKLASGPGGIQAGPFAATSVVTIAPDQSYQELYTLGRQLPNGPWQATFTLTSGLLSKTDTVTVDFDGAPVGTGGTFPAVPVAAGAGALVVLGVAALFIARARRRGRVSTA